MVETLLLEEQEEDSAVDMLLMTDLYTTCTTLTVRIPGKLQGMKTSDEFAHPQNLRNGGVQPVVALT